MNSSMMKGNPDSAVAQDPKFSDGLNSTLAPNAASQNQSDYDELFGNSSAFGFRAGDLGGENMSRHESLNGPDEWEGFVDFET
jgi:hypothetical protein